MNHQECDELLRVRDVSLCSLFCFLTFKGGGGETLQSIWESWFKLSLWALGFLEQKHSIFDQIKNLASPQGKNASYAVICKHSKINTGKVLAASSWVACAQGDVPGTDP